MKLVREHINEISLGGSHLERMGIGMKASIKKWLDEHNTYYHMTPSYTINNDLTIDVEGSIKLYGIDIPNFIKFRYISGGLYLNNSSITSLPDGLEVKWSVDLSGTDIISLPNNFKVGGELNIKNTHITSLPRDIEVKGKILCWLPDEN